MLRSSVVCLCVLLTLSGVVAAQSQKPVLSSFNGPFVTNNILQRVHKVRVGQNVATGFTIEVDEKQYFITARHLLDDTSPTVPVEIFHDGEWRKINGKRLEVAPSTVDIAVLAFEQQISTTLPISFGTKGVALSQGVFFLGYPLERHKDGGKLNNGFPLPFVKHGIISAFEDDKLLRGEPFYIDAINVAGFSGGPIVTMDDSGTPNIIGVVAGMEVYMRKVNEKESIFLDAGLLSGYNIEYALSSIKKNPVGFSIAPPQEEK